VHQIGACRICVVEIEGAPPMPPQENPAAFEQGVRSFLER